jgi:hypothetical protein
MERDAVVLPGDGGCGYAALAVTGYDRAVYCRTIMQKRWI